MTTFTLTMALLMGLASSLHCAGMCGPIIWVMPFQAMQGARRLAGIGLYHLGRISVYAMLGLVLYSFRSFFNPQLQQYISIILGAGLLLAGLITFFPAKKLQISLPWGQWVQRMLGRFMSRPGLGALLLTGALNGLLPCGMVYMALAAAVTANSAPMAAGAMLAFGAGTTPLLVALTLLRQKASWLRMDALRRLAPVLMFAFGCLFILRGMNLGIPYISPKVQLEQHTITSSCCHKE